MRTREQCKHWMSLSRLTRLLHRYENGMLIAYVAIFKIFHSNAESRTPAVVLRVATCLFYGLLMFLNSIILNVDP